jgi:hypothetical protein
MMGGWRAYAAVAVVIGAGLLGYDVGVVLTKATQARAIAAAQAQALARTAQMKRDVEKVANDYETERAAMADRANAADLALARLRADIIRTGGATQPAIGGDGGARARELLADCAAEYRRVAGAADGYRAQLVTLQAYVRATDE